MVIGISGRLGSGKDTVGEIIQYLTGVDADGKFSKHLNWSHTSSFEVKKFAGTEAMRDGLHTNVWVNGLFADYKAMPNKTMEESFMEQFVTGSSAIRYTYPNWIITDMRFPNEIAAVELRGGITIRVNRDNGTREIDTNPHPSETALDDAKFDYVIENDGTLDELVEKVRAILIREKIIS